MIYNDGNSELHIRLHIAEMLKEKIEQPNYNELCEKALKFVMDGIELPKIKKTPAEEAADMFAKTFIFANPIHDALKELNKNDLPKAKDELKELYKKHKAKIISVKNHECSICGYSPEFDCLIAGTNDICDDGIQCGDSDVIRMYYFHYFYVSKDAVE